jgi:hypothetical protein
MGEEECLQICALPGADINLRYLTVLTDALQVGLLTRSVLHNQKNQIKFF